MIIRTFGEIYFNYKLLRHFSTMINSFETLFEARERKFQQERLFRGESVDLVARITTDGVLDNLSSYAISGVYQAVDDPDGHIYSINSEILNGKAILHWTDENDFGKNAYNVWGLLTKDGKAAYPIAWRLNFAHSPSYPLSAIDPLVRTIDFNNYDLLNAPWLPLSGDTMYENSFIRFPVDEDTSIQFDKDGIEKLSATTLTTEPMSGYCWHTIIDPVPDYEIQWFTESELANWNYEESIPPWQNSRLRLCATKPAETHTDVSTIVNLSVPNDEEGNKTIATREWTQENTDEKLNDYLPLSGGTVTGELSVTGTFGSSNFKADAGVGIMIGYNAKAKSGSIAIGSSSDVTNAYYGGSNVAVGTAAKIGSTSQTDCAVAVGNGATVNGNHGIAIGHAADAVGANSIAIGSSGSRVQATAPESIQIGGLSNGLWTPNNTPHSLKVFDKMVLSGDNLTLDPERIPYLSAYETKVAATTEHQTLSTDLTAYVEERIGEIPQPEPPPVAGVLTIKKNETTIVEYNPDASQNLTATITVPTKVTDLDDNIGIATQNELSTNYATKSEMNTSFNNARSYTDEQIEALSSTYETKQHASDTYQTKSDAVADLAFINGKISDVATDLSTNYLPLSGGTVDWLSVATEDYFNIHPFLNIIKTVELQGEPYNYPSIRIGAENFAGIQGICVGGDSGRRYVVEITPGTSADPTGVELINPTRHDIDLNDLVFVDSEGNPTLPYVGDRIIAYTETGVQTYFTRNAANTAWGHKQTIPKPRPHQVWVSGGTLAQNARFYYVHYDSTQFSIQFPVDTINSIGQSHAEGFSIAIGNDTMAGAWISADVLQGWTNPGAIAIGHGTIAKDMGTLGLGTNSLVEGEGSIGIGFNANTSADYAIQLGTGTNSTKHSLQYEDTQIVAKTYDASLSAWTNPKLNPDLLPNALSAVTLESWTFTLTDDTTVTKNVLIG